jgi:tRNA threonylcarbamoyladenosine biosynthesis protein TsaB
MLTLAIETATRHGSVASCDDGLCRGRVCDMARTHAERLPLEMTEWLGSIGRTLPDVDLFAVISGPGSFTGLRVGIAAVQGMALAGGRSVVPVPTLDAMVAGWLAGRLTGSEVVVPCVDGQRGEVFAAVFDTAGAASFDACIELVPAMAARPEEVATTITSRIGGRDVVVVHREAAQAAEALAAALAGASVVELTMPLAEAAARLAAAHPERAVAPHALRPLYVRRPDAELARARLGVEARARQACTVRRAASRDDLDAVDALQRQTFANPWGTEAIRWELENSDVSRLYVMHDGAGRLVAYCACWMVFDELHINSLAVDVGRRREGHARRLLEHVLGESAGAGAQSATLEVRASNAAARALYEGLGFQVEGLRRDYYQEPREDAVILWKRGLKRVEPAEHGRVGGERR